MQFSKDSQSNGALMRCTPLAVWGARLTDDQLAAAAMEDCRLSHPHVVTQVRVRVALALPQPFLLEFDASNL